MPRSRAGGAHPHRLVVLYDSNCKFCCAIRRWILGQPKFVEMEFIGAATPRARHRFPALDHEATRSELTVIGSGGEVYRAHKAYLICLWALRKYRGWALTLATPALLPSARRFLRWVSLERGRGIRRDLAGIEG